jgi:hypothetical protein
MFCILITTSLPEDEDEDVDAGALVDAELDELLELLPLLPHPAVTSASAVQASRTLVSLVMDASSWARVGCFLLA